MLYTYPVQGDAGNPTIDMGTPRMGDVSAYLFTVNGQTGLQQQGVITTPVPGSTLSDSSETFKWNAGMAATAYWIDVGTVVGGNQYYQSGNLRNDYLTPRSTAANRRQHSLRHSL